MSKTRHPSPVLLLILDGWGYRQENTYNAIATAKKPYWDALIKTYPHTLLQASGLSVGLPEGQMGNSEVGHLTLGAGRTLYQDLTRIDKAIADGEFFKNTVFLSGLKKAKKTKKPIHILGLLSPGGVHSHEKHIYALLQLIAKQGINDCYIHAFLDGRDTPPKSAQASLIAIENQCKQLGTGKIASLIGRYYAMDRDKRWERTQAAYDCLTLGKASYTVSSALEGLEKAYARGESDEFIKPTSIHTPDKPPLKIQEEDVVFFMNFRSDRARQISRAFLDPHFSGFKRLSFTHLGDFISLTQYAKDIKSHIAFPLHSVQNGLGEYLSKQKLTQLRIAETEKYAHVTFFFNGGIEAPFPYETRVLIPSKKVATYDLTPKMSTPEITEYLVKVIKEQKYDLIVCNFANPDMLGHTGNFAATQQAIYCIDQCLNKIIENLKKQGGEAIITADHGNAEYMYDETIQQPHTAHTCAQVPFIYVGRPAEITPLTNKTLADVAPTLLALLKLPKPKEMTGHTLIKLCI